ncbi:MAG: PVC-type heme-binding CxxCH protein, partial [Planctomycetota bacterium]
WTNPGFHNLVERGVRWATKNDPQGAGTYLDDVPFPIPETTEIADTLDPFEYEDVGKKIPNYTKSKQWGQQGEPLNLMQKPVAAEQSMQHIVVPKGFHVELFASEPDLGGKPICMAWDERGRLWVAETMDYPNELKPPTKGRDRIRICEDTDGDGRADKFTVFAENLSIPTSIAFYKGGVIVQNGVETLYLKDTTGDDQCDFDKTLFKGWQLGDTHGGVSNFQYGLDNWIWAMQGYNHSKPVVDGEEQQAFRMGFFRFKPDGSELEFIRSTNNNTWGLGISEEGLIFGSTANGNPSIYMPIPNRYYERVRGWAARLTLSSIAESNDFNPITEKVRQVDWHGGYTAGAGHALYTAREYPQEYWNRVAFVNGPTGHLVGAFVLKESGTDFSSKNSFNLFASNDEWTAPIMSEVGPDGQMWVLDWYNYIVQHNPTPRGFESGKGNAYETDLRDKRHGRIYRVVADGSKGAAVPDLSKATPQELVAALAHPTMVVRKHAQRLLVERGESDVAAELIDLVGNEQVDEIGLNVAAIHALWAMQGLGLLDGANDRCRDAAYAALSHPSAGVRRNALQVLPPTEESVNALAKAGLHQDRNAHVRLAAMLALADLPPTQSGAAAILDVMLSPGDLADRWIPDAISSAAAQNNELFLKSLANVETSHPKAMEIATRVANHYARGDDTEQAAEILTGLAGSDPAIIQAVAHGLKDGWRSENQVTIDDSVEDGFERLIKRLPMASRGMLVTLATEWGSTRMEKYGEQVVEAYLEQVANADASEPARIVAATQLIDFRKDDDKVATALIEEITPQLAPEVARGFLRAVGNSRSDAVGPAIVSQLAGMTPSLKKAALSELLKRPNLTRALLNSAKDGKVSLTDLALDQQQALASHPDKEIRDEAAKLLKEGGSLPNADRQKVVEQYLLTTKQSGNGENGKAVFAKHCSKCHLHSGEGNAVGPDLTGMS